MPNPLTGNFEAVVLVSLRQIDGLLAALHQNGFSSQAPLKLLHSVRTRIGDPRRTTPDVTAFGDWVAGYERGRPGGPRVPVRDLLVAGAPAGVSNRLVAGFAGLAEVLDPNPPDLVRGSAEVQISTVRVEVAEGSSDEVTVVADVRARYWPDAGTTPLPTPVHGVVRAAYEVRRTVSGAGVRLLVRPSSQDAKISFIPASGSGLAGADAARVAAEVRKFLRDGLSLLPVDLPSGFPFSGFMGVSSGAGAAVALPLQLSAAAPPSGGLQGVTGAALGLSGFAFAVSREHVQGLIDVEAIRDAVARRRITFRVSVLGMSGSVTYRLRFTEGPSLAFVAGGIDIAGRIAVETSAWWAPNGFVRFRQRVTLVLDPASQRVDLVAVGGPVIDKSWFIPRSSVAPVVESEVAAALEANRPGVRGVFRDARSDLVDALETFEPTASADYSGVEVTPDGVVARGDISTAPRLGAVVDIGETDGGREFTAFESWVPGGWIDRYDWSWIEQQAGVATPWRGVVKSASETGRFTLAKPPGPRSVSRVCLRVSGTRLRPGGQIQPVIIGTTCQIDEPVLSIDAPSWWEPVTLPVWEPGLADGARLRDGVAAHISVQSDRPAGGPGHNVLVVFPDWGADAPFDVLVRGLGARRRAGVPMALVVVLPDGSFDATRREVEARLAGLAGAAGSLVEVTEDIGGGWARTFGVGERPALFLVTAQRKFAWSAGGDFEPSAIGAALDEHLVAAPPPKFRPLRLTVPVGEPAPDFHFTDGRGEAGALHRLRGRQVVLAFWQSWSAPCLAELRRLQALATEGSGRAPVVLAVHGGAGGACPDGLGAFDESSLRMVADPQHRIARAFGVRCWPTTVTVDPDGRIEQAGFGGSVPGPPRSAE